MTQFRLYNKCPGVGGRMLKSGTLYIRSDCKFVSPCGGYFWVYRDCIGSYRDYIGEWKRTCTPLFYFWLSAMPVLGGRGEQSVGMLL